MAKVKKFKVLSFGIFQALLMALIGLVAGILYSFGGLLIDTLVTIGMITSQETPGLSYGTVLAFGALIGMPILFGAFGFILGIIEAILYNLFAKLFGGIEIDFKQKV
tara:strand:+ start:431 stop:751 length:321 start_codon:yes stop_codon:yes gene_type:complete